MFLELREWYFYLFVSGKMLFSYTEKKIQSMQDGEMTI